MNGLGGPKSPAIPGWQGWPFRKDIDSVKGFSGTSPEDVEKLSSCVVARLRGRLPRDTVAWMRGRLGLYKSGH